MNTLSPCSSLAKLVIQASVEWPHNVAVQRGSNELTYADLSIYAQKFACYLMENGVSKGDSVILLLENSLEYVVALTGIFLATGVAVPVNPDVTTKSLQHIGAISNAQVIITREKISDRLSLGDLGVRKIILENEIIAADKDLTSTDKNNLIKRENNEHDVAMVLFTSGTTGPSKGVVLTHSNILANVRSVVQYLKLTSKDSILTILSFFYSYGNSVLLTHLAVGAKVVIENNFIFPNKVVENLQKVRPTGFSGVPSTFYVLLNRSTFPKQDWTFFRYVTQAGGAMQPDTIKELERIMPGVDLYIMYGQTEGSARLSYLNPALLKSKIGSVGQGIPGVKLRLVDDSGGEVQPGEVGEIIARGDNVMRGYLEDEAATSQALRDGWLYTGDLAKIDSEGFFYIVGRKKDIIKTAGYRVSPNEIEEVLARLPEVYDVAVVGLADNMLGEAIVACIVKNKEDLNVEDLIKHCRQNLSFYKVPKKIIFLSELPRTDSGKIRYNVLREICNNL